jgi:hypothetical protein
MGDTRFFAPYFNDDVILTAERRRHIELRHADLGSDREVDRMIQETLDSPRIIQKSARDTSGRVFIHWQPHLHNGKFLLVVVIDDPERKWIITAYSSHEIPEGEILWQQD